MHDPRPLRHVDLHNDAGRLEAIYRDIEEPVAAAIVCHPHPVHGGTLHNKVVFRAARGLESANVATLRFNFRGAGRSQGVHDHGTGEIRDFDTAFEWVRQKHPSLPLLVGGFSFGSWVASRAALEHEDIHALFLLGAPVNNYDLGYLSNWKKPMMIVQGSKDEFGHPDKLAPLVERIPNCELFVVTGADHFFSSELEFVEETIREWAVRMLEDSPAPRQRQPKRTT